MVNFCPEGQMRGRKSVPISRSRAVGVMQKGMSCSAENLRVLGWHGNVDLKPAAFVGRARRARQDSLPFKYAGFIGRELDLSEVLLREVRNLPRCQRPLADAAAAAAARHPQLDRSHGSLGVDRLPLCQLVSRSSITSVTVKI